MARRSYGDDVKARVRKLLEAFLAYANDELEQCQPFKKEPNWKTSNQVIFGTNLRELADLTNLKKEQVREALKRLQDFLGILEDVRVHTRGSEDWEFKLTLWYEKSNKQGNLQKFDEEWQSRREKLSGVQRTEARKAKPTPTCYNNLPLSGATKFVGREAELENLHQLLQQNDQVAIAAIAGMGGVGKTELALQYARKHLTTYQGGVCWLQALQDIGLRLVQFARIQFNLNPPEDFDVLAQVEYCWRNWREGEVLLVLDNVSNYKEVIKPYLLASSSRFKVLMTTRQLLGGSIAKLSLDVLQPEAALELLRTLVGTERINVEALYATSLCERLGYLPLGIELVGRYLARKEDLSLEEMLQRLEAKGLKERSLSKAEDGMTAQQGVQAAFELSWQELSDTDKQLACLLSLFALAPIPWEWVKKCLPDLDAEELEESRDDKLLNLHLLQRKDKEIYQLHPLLREFFRAKLAASEKADVLKRGFADVIRVEIARKFPDSLTKESINSLKDDIPHLEEVAQNLTDAVSDKNLISLLFRLGKFYSAQGLYALAQPWCEQFVSVARRSLGQEHRDYATSLDNLGNIFYFQERYEEAEPLYQEALAIRARVSVKKHPDCTTSLNHLGNLRFSQKRYQEARDWYQYAVDLTREMQREGHPDFATYVNNLAKVYCFQERYEDAEPLYLDAVELTRSSIQQGEKYREGEKYRDLATSLNNLAYLYYLQERYEEAEPLYLEALAIRETVQGKEHPDYATSLESLADLYTSQKRYEKAKPLYEEALAIRETVQGKEHHKTVKVRKKLESLRDK